VTASANQQAASFESWVLMKLIPPAPVGAWLRKAIAVPSATIGKQLK
jgi:hypothetical protein